MRYRISVGGVYETTDHIAFAQSQALDHARELTRACGFPVTVMVHRMGSPERDDLGRDVTPAFFVGSAVGRIENKVAFVRWVPASTKGAPTRCRMVAA